MLDKLEEDIADIKEKKQNWETSLKEIYLALFKVSVEKLEEAHQMNSNVRPAVNIRQIVKKKGIEIIEKKGLFRSSYFLNEIAGYLDYMNGENGSENAVIFLEDDQDELSKRYVIAHEYSHYLLRDENKETKFCPNMLFFAKQEEQLCDIMTAFLLMPIGSVLRVMDLYMQERKNQDRGPSYTNEWFRYLAYNFKVTDYHVILCYQQIRYLGAALYDAMLKGSIETEDLKKWGVDIQKYQKYFWKK